MKMRTPILVLGIAIGLVTGTASGGVNEKMQEMFGSANTTQPGYVDSLSRGVITGGNASIRSPIVNPGGVGFDPPSISAGCGGIDMYGGNLSFPSKEQYVAAARAIAMNIGGYAFKQGLKQLCDVCESVMSQIQDTVNELNMGNMDSCQIAQGIVDGSYTDAAKTRGDNIAAIWKTDRGDSKDRFEASNNGSKDGPADDAAGDPQMRMLMEGNWTLEALEGTEAFDWLGNDRGTREEIMSLLGTVVTCVPGQNGCKSAGGDRNSPTPTIFSPSLRLQDFVALEHEASRDYEIYRCNNDECLDPSPNASRSLGKSASQRIVDTLLGTPENPGVILRSISSGVGSRELSRDEKTMIALAGDDYAVALNCASAGPTGAAYARTIIEAVAPRITANVLHGMSQQSLTYLIKELNLRSAAIGTDEGVKMLEKSSAALRTQHGEILAAIDSKDKLRDAVLRCGANPIGAATMGGI